MPSIGQILQPFTGNGDVSIWVKIFEWDDKPQTNKQINKRVKADINMKILLIKQHILIEQIVSMIYAVEDIFLTRPKPVELGYVFSMAVGTIEKWLKLVPF